MTCGNEKTVGAEIRPMTYEEALEYIHGISWTFCKPGLERTRELCRGLGDPQKNLKFIHVAGTNGKGSFCSMLAGILAKSGHRVGLYTSPYVLRFNERMQIGGLPIPDERLAEITARVRPVADGMTDRPTEFELITAIAFCYFAEEGVDVVVLEAGMGGRLDSTNIIEEPLLSVITGIALDHTAFLGDTVEKIAAEKAGIIKEGRPVLWGGEDKDAERVIAARATEKNAPMYVTNRDSLRVRAATLDGTDFDFDGWEGLHLSLLGLYQPRNAASVLTAVRALREGGMEIPDAAVRAGLADARWPARFEVIDRSPLTLFDGAHNPDGISAAVKSIRHYFADTGVIAVSGVLRDKDYAFIARELASVAVRVYTMTPDSPRALGAEEYAAELQKNGVDATPCGSVAEALCKARADGENSGIPVICLGSLYTYAEVIGHIGKTE